MHPSLRAVLLALLAFLAAALPSGLARAHAILIDSTPAANGTVAGGEIAFTLRFNSRIDKARSRLQLFAPDKSQKTLAIAPGGSEDVLVTKATLPEGSYRLRWQVLAIDGHITRGDVPFTVAAAATAP
jgi:hypothetical protein